MKMLSSLLTGLYRSPHSAVEKSTALPLKLSSYFSASVLDMNEQPGIARF